MPLRLAVADPPGTSTPASAATTERVVARVVGDIDVATAPTLRRALELLWQSGEVVVVDLADVAFIDSRGMAVLSDMRHLYGDGRFSLRAASAKVTRLLEATGLDQVLRVE